MNLQKTINLSGYKMRNGYLLVRSLKEEGKDEKSGIYVSVEKDEQAQTSRCEVLLTDCKCPKEYTTVPDESVDHPDATKTIERIKCNCEFSPQDIVFFSKLVPDDVIVKTDDGDVELWFVRSADVKMSYAG